MGQTKQKLRTKTGLTQQQMKNHKEKTRMKPKRDVDITYLNKKK
jgi:hypothetical protein